MAAHGLPSSYKRRPRVTSNLIAAEYTAKMIPGAKLSLYQGIGQAPFFEDAPRFNAELAAFVRSAQK